MDHKYIEGFYNPEFSKPLTLCFKMLNRGSIHLYDANLSKFEKYWKYFVVVPAVILFYITMTLYMMVNVISETKDVVDMALAAPIYMIAFQTIIRTIILTLDKSKIVQIIDDLGTMWRTIDLTETQLKKKNAMLKKIDVCQRVFYAVSISGSWLFTFSPLAETLLRRYIFQQDCELLLPYPGRYPFDPTKSLSRYIMLYVFQSYCMLKCVFIYLGCEFLMVAICSHLITEFTILREDLVNLRPSKNTRNDLEYIEDGQGMDIRDFIKRHQRLINLSKNLDDVFNKINFIVLCFATVITCFFAFAARVSPGGIFMFINYIGVVGMLVPLFILCYFSELLATESAGVAEAAYENLWYEGGRNYQKSICFIILRSQRACCLTSLKYAPINLATFSKVLSTTWSYFSLVYRVYENTQ